MGVIPEEWELAPVGRMGEVVTGKALAVNALGPQRPYLRTKNVFDGRIDIDDVLSMPMSDAQFKQFALKHGDVLLNEGQSLELVGRCAIYRDEYPEPCAIQNQLLRFRAKPGASGEFASHLFRYSQRTGVFARVALQTTSIAHLGGKRFENLVLAWPPEPEQRAIAAALSDVDALLGGLGRLITKKRDLKQAAMQQLLTGQTRLPGFHGEWEVKWLGDLFRFSGGYSASRDQLSTEGHCYLHYGDIHGSSKTTVDTDADFQDIPKLNIPLNRVSRDSLLEDGDVVFVDASEDDEGASKHVVVVNKDGRPFISGLHTIVAKAKTSELAHEYRRYCFQTAAIREQFLYYAVGTKVSGISKTNIAKLTLPVPSVPEQAAIATVLSDMDAELSALEARRDKTRALKQAMMQELLTGKTRLVESAFQTGKKDAVRTDGQRVNIHFKRCVLAAEIVDRLHEEPTFGHVKFEKMIFLVEHLCKVDTGSTYHRDAAGPYDNRAIRSIDSQLRKQKWFDAQKSEGRYRYVPMRNRGKHKEYFERYFSGVRASFEKIIDTFRSFDTERCEIVATLFGAWNDLVQQHMPVSDEAILHEVLNNWHESKKRIPRNRWRKALGWMRGHGFVPTEAREKANP